MLAFPVSDYALSSAGSHDAAQVVGGEFEDGDAAPGEVLLVADVLVTGDEKIELRLRERLPCGSVSSWNSRAVTGSSERLN